MAKKNIVKFSGIKQSGENLLKFINTQLKDDRLLREVGEITVDQIKRRTRGRQEEYKQDPLKPLTVAQRSVYIQNFGGDDLASPKQSNLTLSGQLLNSLRHKIQQGLAVIYLYDPRKSPVQNKTRAQIIKGTKFDGSKNNKKLLGIAASYLAQPQESKTNTQVKNDLEKIKRKFFFVSEKLNTLLTNKISQMLRRKLSTYRRLLRK
jgi:hypothetical protein